MEEKIYKDTIEFNSKSKVNRSKKILSALEEFDDDIPLPSSLYTKTKEDKKKDKKEITINDDDYTSVAAEKSLYKDDNDWMTTLASFKAPKTKKKSKKNMFDGFDLDTGEKKHKKKDKEKKKGEMKNYKKDFDPELAILRSIQMEQSRFTDSLQKKYDQLESTKSTARGVGKFTTDLINAITTARSANMQMVDKIISTKKSIADLDFKERKEFGSQSGTEQQNLTNYASTYLKQVMSMGRNNVVGQPQAYENFDNVSDDDTDDLFSSIDESLGDVDRSEDVEKYLKYENDGVEVKVIWHDSCDDEDARNHYDYIAYNKDGDVVSDYPLPEKTKMSINRSTGISTDLYGNKYKMIID